MGLDPDYSLSCSLSNSGRRYIIILHILILNLVVGCKFVSLFQEFFHMSRQHICSTVLDVLKESVCTQVWFPM